MPVLHRSTAPGVHPTHWLICTQVAVLAGGLGRLVFTRIKPHTFLSHDDFTNHDLLRDTGINKSEAFIFALREAWRVKPWHYPAAVGFGLVGAILGFAGEIAGAVFEAVGLKVLCRLDATRLSGNWTKLWRRVTDRECLSLGAFLQPLIGGVFIAVWKSKFYGAFVLNRRPPPRHRRDSCSIG